MTHERRQDRSDNPWTAGDLYLRAVAQRTGLEHLTLATREGLCLSGTGDKALGDRVAAVAPLFVEEPATLRAGLIDELTDGQPMQVWRVTVRDRPFYLIGFGALTDMSEEVQGAFDRIFARPTPRTSN
ncbi:hypothetical protein [Nannocystis punicea]|uniref:Uncharacterized protein n=1 Tax=Nannocystis punicea TaxID=2995304 RepID=A0ABY7HFJ1_9BACT|nr:hypothetical protein [Nannocystis poenicansa]WAS97855.1 hypothetical protein O0S08_17070 [Nannocystis poenicansa]